jgi:hypothetical protein
MYLHTHTQRIGELDRQRRAQKLAEQQKLQQQLQQNQQTQNQHRTDSDNTESTASSNRPAPELQSDKSNHNRSGSALGGRVRDHQGGNTNLTGVMSDNHPGGGTHGQNTNSSAGEAGGHYSGQRGSYLADNSASNSECGGSNFGGSARNLFSTLTSQGSSRSLIGVSRSGSSVKAGEHASRGGADDSASDASTTRYAYIYIYIYIYTCIYI